jgi:peptide/nickel transport system substrate-binding protein
MPATDVRLLGPIEVTLDGRPIEVAATKQRAVLAMLALRPNAVVSVDELIDGLWGESPPATAVKQIQQYVSQLRKALAGGDMEIVTRGHGYELRARADAVDVGCFERLADAAVRGDGDGSAARSALALWRGSPLIDVIDQPFAAAELRRLEELWLSVSEHAIADDLDAGRHDEVVARLDELVARHPLRERLHALRMRALYGAGRQADALEAFRQARATLVEEVGVEPGPELQRLHEAMLRQEPHLAPAPRPARRRSGSEAAGGRPYPGSRRLSRAIMIAAAVALLAGGAAFAVSRITATDRSLRVGENAVGRIDLAGAGVAAEYKLGREPRALTTGAGSVWVADASDETVSRLDPGRDRVFTIPVGSDPAALAFGGGALWVAERADGTVAQVSPGSNKVIGRTSVGNGPSSIAVGYGSVWVGSAVDRSVSRIFIPSMELSPPIRLGAPVSAIATGAGSVWVTSEETGTLFKIDPRTGAVVGRQVGNRPVAVAAAESGVWVVNRQDATVWRIDPRTNLVKTIDVPRDPGPIATSGADAWVAAGDASVSRIDGRTDRVARSVDLGHPATALAAGAGSLWTATQPTPAGHRGGTVVVATGSFSRRALYPLVYDAQTQEILSLVYDGLLSYRRTGGTTAGPLVADLASDVPAPSRDGLTYVFRLRPGIRFSNGATLEPADVRASLEDLLERHGRELSGELDAIVGARRCAREPAACDLSRGVITDAGERTITLRLERPDPSLLHKLAGPVTYIAPAGLPFRRGRISPGTGPYRVAQFDRAHGVELTRNPNFEVWSQDARPDGVPDRIRFRFEPDVRTRVDAVEQGDVDVVTIADPFGPDLSARAIRALAARDPERLHTSPTPSLFYMWMNVRVAPFDDVRVRRALNFALDRHLIAELRGGEPLARPACHFAAPGHPGYFPACDYTRDPDPSGVWSAPDFERARALVARSGTAGQTVTVAVPADERRIGRYLARLLAGLGYRSRLSAHGDFGEYHGDVADSRHRAQLGIDGWAAAFPTPADFVTPYTCASFEPRSPANTNLSELCDPALERRIDAALAAEGADADERWRGVFTQLARLAPAAPLVNYRGAVLTSKRLGNYQHHPLFGTLLDQVWVR